MRRRSWQVWQAAVVALLATAVATSRAAAHATLVRSEPADNAVLAEPPPDIRLWFNEPISGEFSTAQVLDIGGRPVEIGGLRVDRTESGLMVLTLAELPAGLYSVRWKVLSEADGHFTQGWVVFGVGEGLDPASVAVAAPAVSVPPVEVLLRWLNLSLLATVAGAVAMAGLVLAPAAQRDSAGLSAAEARRAAQRRVLGWAAGCAGLALAVGIGLLLWQISVLLATLPEGASVHGVGWQLLGRTRWGRLWTVRQVLLLALAGALFLVYRGARDRERSGTAALPVAGLLVVALMLVQASGGHAAALAPSAVLAVVVDALHLLAAGLWVGGLVALVVGLFPLLSSGRAEAVALAGAGWRAFGGIAAVSVAVLLATGLYSLGRQVASVDAFVTTLYGRALAGKIGLMLAVGGLGLLNSMLLHPRGAAPLARLLGRKSGWTPLPVRRLPALVLAEASAGLFVLLAAGLVTAAPPARGPEFAPAAEAVPTFRSQTVDDLVVSLSVKPNRPGPNVFTLRATSVRRPPPAEIMRVIVRFTAPGQGGGHVSADAVELERGLYQFGGSYLSLAGPWQVQVVVRRRGIVDGVASFEWVVPAPVPPRPAIISDRPWEPFLTGAAAGIILLIPVVAVALWLVRGRFAPASHHRQPNIAREGGFHDETRFIRPTRSAHRSDFHPDGDFWRGNSGQAGSSQGTGGPTAHSLGTERRS